MAESIEDKTTREMVEDRDLVLAAKELEIAGLNEQIVSLSSELRNAWQHPLADDAKATKEMLSDYERTVALMEGRMKNPLGDRSLFDVVRNAMVSHDMISDERDRYKSAWIMVHRAASKSRDVVDSK